MDRIRTCSRAIRVRQPVTDCADPLAPRGTILAAPSGQELPVQPKFKANIVGALRIPAGRLRCAPAGRVGLLRTAHGPTCAPPSASCSASRPSYSIVDLSFGVENDSWGLELFVKNAFDERAELARFTECGIFQPLTDPTERRAAVRLAAVHRDQHARAPSGLTFSKKF